MTSYEIVPFRPVHLADIEPPALCDNDLGLFIAAYREMGPAYSAMRGGRAMGCAGVAIVDAVGWAWAILGEEIRKSPHFLHRAAVRGLKKIEQEYGVAIRATALAEFAGARRWLERLGFRPIGTHDDRVMYAR